MAEAGVGGGGACNITSSCRWSSSKATPYVPPVSCSMHHSVWQRRRPCKFRTCAAYPCSLVVCVFLSIGLQVRMERHELVASC